MALKVAEENSANRGKALLQGRYTANMSGAPMLREDRDAIGLEACHQEVWGRTAAQRTAGEEGFREVVQNYAGLHGGSRCGLRHLTKWRPQASQFDRACVEGLGCKKRHNSYVLAESHVIVPSDINHISGTCSSV